MNESTPDEGRYPARRAMAADNRAKILRAARAAFLGAEGEVSMAEVARRAGVGMATLYRNFPGRPELVEALYADEVNALCAAAEPAPGQPAVEALTAWLRELFGFLPRKTVILAELFDRSERADAIVAGNRNRALAAGRPLLAAAQGSGDVRRELTIEQIFDLIVAIAKIDAEPGYVEPMLDTLLAGLRVDASTTM